jgi:diguanylate cyclase (GGDEF)-like protein
MSTVATTSITELPLWGQLAISAVIGAIIAGGGAFVFARLIRRQTKNNVDGDSVTGVANRRAFVERLEAEWQSAASGGGDFGVLVVDVDAFGDINHFYGRATGDRVLAEVAERIRLRVRDGDYVARVDADEFGVVCPGVRPEDLQTMRRNLEAYVNFAQSVPVALSIGVATPAEGDTSGLDLLERARNSLAQRREGRPVRVVDDALSALLTPR